MIDEYTTNILEIIENSIKASANKYTNNKVNLKVVPGWNDEVKPYAMENAMFLNAIWVSAGKPINVLHRIMKRMRNLYHYQIRKCKRSVKIIKKGKLLDACGNGKGNIFDKDETLKLLGQVNEHIGDLSINDVNMVTSDIVRKATKQIKLNRIDPVIVFKSDCLKRAPPCYFNT